MTPSTSEVRIGALRRLAQSDIVLVWNRNLTTNIGWESRDRKQNLVATQLRAISKHLHAYVNSGSTPSNPEINAWWFSRNWSSEISDTPCDSSRPLCPLWSSPPSFESAIPTHFLPETTLLRTPLSLSRPRNFESWTGPEPSFLFDFYEKLHERQKANHISRQQQHTMTSHSKQQVKTRGVTRSQTAAPVSEWPISQAGSINKSVSLPEIRSSLIWKVITKRLIVFKSSMHSKRYFTATMGLM